MERITGVRMKVPIKEKIQKVKRHSDQNKFHKQPLRILIDCLPMYSNSENPNDTLRLFRLNFCFESYKNLQFKTTFPLAIQRQNLLNDT